MQVAISSHLAPGDVFFDVGANIGFFSLIAARSVGDGGHIFAFEPVPENARAITRNARANRLSNVTVLQTAVAAHRERRRLVLSEHPGGAALHRGDSRSPAGAIDVDAVAIDDLVERGHVSPPDLVKIDVEGAEIEVIAGMQRTIDAHRPLIIYEVDAPDDQQLEERDAPLVEALRDAGYEIERLPDSYPTIAWSVRHSVASPAAPI